MHTSAKFKGRAHEQKPNNCDVNEEMSEEFSRAVEMCGNYDCKEMFICNTILRRSSITLLHRIERTRRRRNSFARGC